MHRWAPTKPRAHMPSASLTATMQRGDADVMICGGSEAAVTPLSVAGFAAIGAISTRNDDKEDI